MNTVGPEAGFRFLVSLDHQRASHGGVELAEERERADSCYDEYRRIDELFNEYVKAVKGAASGQ